LVGLKYKNRHRCIMNPFWIPARVQLRRTWPG
jgi:hypothetical protein